MGCPLFTRSRLSPFLREKPSSPLIRPHSPQFRCQGRVIPLLHFRPHSPPKPAQPATFTTSHYPWKRTHMFTFEAYASAFEAHTFIFEAGWHSHPTLTTSHYPRKLTRIVRFRGIRVRFRDTHVHFRGWQPATLTTSHYPWKRTHIRFRGIRVRRVTFEAYASTFEAHTFILEAGSWHSHHLTLPSKMNMYCSFSRHMRPLLRHTRSCCETEHMHSLLRAVASPPPITPYCHLPPRKCTYLVVVNYFNVL